MQNQKFTVPVRVFSCVTEPKLYRLGSGLYCALSSGQLWANERSLFANLLILRITEPGIPEDTLHALEKHMTLGSYLIIISERTKEYRRFVFAHEFAHYLQDLAKQEKRPRAFIESWPLVAAKLQTEAGAWAIARALFDWSEQELVELDRFADTCFATYVFKEAPYVEERYKEWRHELSAEFLRWAKGYKPSWKRLELFEPKLT